MVKTYKAIGTIVSTGVEINGRFMRIRFTPVSNYIAGQRGSEFTTDDPEIQKALESTSDFGTVFNISYQSKPDVENYVNDPNDQTVITEQHNEKRVITVDSIQDAKNYLVDNFGWDLPKCRITKKVISDAGEAYGVIFEGLK